MSRYAFMRARARQYRADLLRISGVSLAGSCATLVLPWLGGSLLGEVVDRGGDGGGPPLVQTVAALLALLAATAVFHVAGAILSARLSGRILADLRVEIHAHMQRLPTRIHDVTRQGDVLALIAYDITIFGTFLSATLAQAPAMLFTLIGALGLLFTLEPWLALAVPLVLPPFYLAMKLLGRRLRQLGADMRAADARVMVQAEQDLQMLAATKSFAVEQVREARFAWLAEAARGLQLRQARLSACIAPVVGLAAAVGVIALLLVSGSALADGGSDPARLFSVLLYAALLTRPVGALADFYGRLQWADGTLAELEAVLAEPVEPGYAQHVRMPQVRGRITFEQVAFAYPGRPTVLCDASLDIAPGEVVALTGANGAGKSTLVNLLLRFHDPAAGRILLDGADIATLDVQWLRRQMALVPQRPLLFDGTVRDNIAYGLTQPDEAAMARAVDLAQAAEFIAALPQGYDTMIGDHGVRLSGGQRQRIALARALVTDPRVLIFDEATSMYDLEAEAAFVESSIKVLKRRTVLVITHRPASLALANRVVVVEGGRIRPA